MSLRPSYRVLEHTADVGFEAYGETREAIFASAACALTDLMVDLRSIEPRESVALKAEGPDVAGLMVNWLSEVLYIWECDHKLLAEFMITKLTDCSIEAKARGEAFDPARHAVKMLVKAITYHQLAVERVAEGWRAQVYVDI